MFGYAIRQNLKIDIHYEITMNSKGFFQPLVVTYLFKIQFSTKNFLVKFFIKVHRFTYSPKTEFERVFPTPRCDTFVQNSICYKKFPSKISHKNSEFSRPLVKTHFCSKKFNRSLFIRGGILLGGVVSLR